MSRSQATIWMVLGLVLLVAFVFMVYSLSTLSYNYEDTPVDGYMSECVEMESKYIFQELGRTGGRFINTTYNTSYLLKDEFLVPSLSEIEQEVEQRLDNGFERCVNNYVGPGEITILEPGYEFTYTDRSVMIEITKPYKVSTESRTVYKEAIPIELDIRLRPILEMVNETLIHYKRDGYIYDEFIIDKINISVQKYDDGIVWEVEDRGSTEYNTPYLFKFATII